MNGAPVCIHGFPRPVKSFFKLAAGPPGMEETCSASVLPLRRSARMLTPYCGATSRSPNATTYRRKLEIQTRRVERGSGIAEKVRQYLREWKMKSAGQRPRQTGSCTTESVQLSIKNCSEGPQKSKEHCIARCDVSHKARSLSRLACH